MLRIKTKDELLVGLGSLVFLGASLAGWLLIGEVVLVFSLAAAMAALLLTRIEIYRRVERYLRRQNRSYRQIESLFSLFSSLDIRHPLPPMRGWAISPDFASLIVSLIWSHRPRTVLEAGSGVSTLVTAYSLRTLGTGIVVSLDHEERFARATAENLKRHGLDDVARVVHAPLKETAIGGKTWLWYDTGRLEEIGSIDLMIVDGPPTRLQDLSRYPALPVLFRLLSDDAVVVLDDGRQKDTRRLVKMWLREFGCFESEVIDTEKGSIVLRRVARVP